MVRTLSAWAVLGLVAATAGCSMCSHPYDYCGPVYSGGCNGYECNGPRAGSIRAMGGPVLAPHPAAMPAELMGSAEGQPAGGSVVFEPSSPLDQIVSPLQTPITSSPVVSSPAPSRQAPANLRQYLPATDRENAQILSVTDETLAEMQARKGGATPTVAEPAQSGDGTWTARRPSATRR